MQPARRRRADRRAPSRHPRTRLLGDDPAGLAAAGRDRHPPARDLRRGHWQASRKVPRSARASAGQAWFAPVGRVGPTPRTACPASRIRRGKSAGRVPEATAAETRNRPGQSAAGIRPTAVLQARAHVVQPPGDAVLRLARAPRWRAVRAGRAGPLAPLPRHFGRAPGDGLRARTAALVRRPPDRVFVRSLSGRTVAARRGEQRGPVRPQLLPRV